MSRATKLGARAGRIVRLVRLLKIFNNLGERKKKDENPKKTTRKRDKS